METCVYGAYGDRVARTVDVPRTAYAGYVREGDLPWYVLGLRIYIPWLRRFIGVDALSPFGEGGLNRYTYCVGDPINQIDPSGQASWKWLGHLLGKIGGAIGKGMDMVSQVTPTTALTRVGAVAEVAAVGTAIGAVAAGALGDESTAGILGWVAAGSGLGGIGLGIAGQAVSKGMTMGRRDKGRSVSGELGGGVVLDTEMDGNWNHSRELVTQSSYVDFDNRLVTNYSGYGLQNMPELNGRIVSADSLGFRLVPGSQEWANANGGSVIGFDSMVRHTHMVAMLRGDNAPRGKVRIFAGVHGDSAGQGDNWGPTGYRENLQISRSAAQLRAKLKRAGIRKAKVYDMAVLTENEFKRKIDKSGTNVLGWCFSIADEKANEVRVGLNEHPFYAYKTYTHRTTDI